jgi:flagellar biogenesis protein FliO
MGDNVGALLDLAWKLALVLGLAVLALRALRWLSTPTASRGPLTLLARVPTGPQQALLLVGLGERLLLIGQSPQQLSLLCELTSGELGLAPGAPGPSRRAANPTPGTNVGALSKRLAELVRSRSGSGWSGPVDRTGEA